MEAYRRAILVLLSWMLLEPGHQHGGFVPTGLSFEYDVICLVRVCRFRREATSTDIFSVCLYVRPLWHVFFTIHSLYLKFQVSKGHQFL